MPKKGIHPVLRTVTYVLKNGASVELPTVQQRSVPYTLQAVSHCLTLFRSTLVPLLRLAGDQSYVPLQDTTTNSLWTGEKKVVSSAGRSAKMMRRYEKMGFKFGGDADEEPSTKQPAQQTGQP